MKNLIELKIELDHRKREFDSYRISNGKVSKLKNFITEETIDDTKTQNYIADNILEIDKSKGNIEDTEDSSNAGEDNIKATKPYSEKIKGGFFGKRRSRF